MDKIRFTPEEYSLMDEVKQYLLGEEGGPELADKLARLVEEEVWPALEL